MYHQKWGRNISFIHKNEKYVNQKYLRRSRTSDLELEPSKSIIKKDGFSIRVLTMVIWNLEEWKRQWNKIVFSTDRFDKLNLLLENQILLILCIFNKPNVWYFWSLKILAIKRWFPLQLHKKFTGSSFCDWWAKNLKLLSDIYFDSGFQKIVLLNLLLFLCACY